MKSFTRFLVQNILALGMIVALTTTAMGISQAAASLTISNVKSSNITEDSATIAWQTNLSSDSQVKYGQASGQYTQSFTLDESVTNHSVELSDLIKNTTYFYRVSSQTPEGISATSDEYTFKTVDTTDTQAPVISDVKVKDITYNAFTITWLTDEPATSKVKYGETQSFGSTYLNNSLVKEHQVTLKNLKSETKYFFQAISSDAASNRASSATFDATTTKAPDTTAPVISNIQVLDITSTSARILWDTNELSDSVVNYGKTTSYGSSKSSAEMVTTHNLLLENLQAGTIYHFQASSKDASGNTATSEDKSFTTLVDTTSPVISDIKATNISQTSAKITWTTNELSNSTVKYGTTESYGKTKTVSAMVTAHSVTISGLKAGTLYHFQVSSTDAYSNKAVSTDQTFTTLADTTAPVISSLQATSISQTSAYIIWYTNEVSDSFVEYGTTETYGQTKSSSSMVTYHQIYLSGLTPNTLYHYRVSSKDASGNKASSEDKTFKTLADTTFPTISNIQTTNITQTSATMTWTTNEPASSEVEYGKTTDYDEAVSDPTLVTSHSLAVTNLEAGTTYHYRVISEDAAGNIAYSSDRQFTTAAASDTQPPVISNIMVSNVTETSAAISWATNEPATSEVEYGETGSYGQGIGTPQLSTYHYVVLNGLKPGTTYHFKVSSADAAGNKTSSGDQTFTTKSSDQTSPVISDIKATNITQTSAAITWTTNELSNSTVKYGTNESYSNTTKTDATMVTAHSVTINGLEAGTLYHFQVISTDQAGNKATSGDQQFTTLTATDTQPPVISNVQASNVTQTSATITWNTNEPANSEVKYGLSTTYDKTASDQQMLTYHQINLTNLQSGTTYHYQANSTDAASNKASSSDKTFTTQTQGDTGEVRTDFALNGNLKTASSTSISVSVVHGSQSAQAQIGQTLTIQVTGATVMTQDGKQVQDASQLIPGSQVNVNGYSQGQTYYANRIEAHLDHFVLSGIVKSVNQASSEVLIEVKVATPPLKSYLGKTLAVKVDSNTIIRINRYYGTISEIPVGKYAEVVGTIENGRAVADRIVVLYR